ncbi:MAG: hypothetical protein HYT67_01390 [Candidatus Yanofskybacteria bacterium]|nr:hypothetical protein [Candidatus Yanofskybacteria bacterium]
MADDQGGPKIASIDELVNELTKKNSSPPKPPMGGQFQPNPAPAPAPSPAPQTAVPQPEIPKPKFTPPPLPSAMPRPATPSTGSQPSQSYGGQAGPSAAPAPMPAPTPKPSAPPPSAAAPVKEYQSSIRTMKEDISTLKMGQKPAGVDVPRKVEAPVPSGPPGPKIVPPPNTPGQFKMPSAGLGQAEKAAPLPQTKEPISPPMPTGRQAVRGPSLPPAGRPAPLPVGGPQKSQIYAPPLPTGGISGSRNRLFGIIIGAAVLFGALYWFLVLRVPEPEVVLETPTPTPVATPIPDLSSVLAGLESQTVCTAGCTVDDFISNISSGTINGGQFKKVYLSENDTSGNVAEVLDSLGLVYPARLKESLGPDSFVLTYGQKEIFDSKGFLVISAPVEKRFVFISEVKDSSLVNQEAKAWEPTLTEAFRQLFGLNPAQQPEPNFLNNTYQGSAIRFRNFPYADRSIDIGVVSAINGKSYLVIAGSRESMFATIDVLKGLTVLSSPTPPPSPIP